MCNDSNYLRWVANAIGHTEQQYDNMDESVRNKVAVTVFKETGISIFLTIPRFLQSPTICTECVLKNTLFHQSEGLDISQLFFVTLPIHQYQVLSATGNSLPIVQK